MIYLVKLSRGYICSLPMGRAQLSILADVTSVAHVGEVEEDLSLSRDDVAFTLAWGSKPLQFLCVKG